MKSTAYYPVLNQERKKNKIGAWDGEVLTY